MNFNPIEMISKLLSFAKFSIGGKMSEKGADKAGKDISSGLKFMFYCIGLGVFSFLFMVGLYFIKWW